MALIDGERLLTFLAEDGRGTLQADRRQAWPCLRINGVHPCTPAAACATAPVSAFDCTNLARPASRPPFLFDRSMDFANCFLPRSLRHHHLLLLCVCAFFWSRFRSLITHDHMIIYTTYTPAPAGSGSVVFLESRNFSFIPSAATACQLVFFRVRPPNH
jgi:hypothetical protein